jgi:hypothetical protein
VIILALHNLSAAGCTNSWSVILVFALNRQMDVNATQRSDTEFFFLIWRYTLICKIYVSSFIHSFIHSFRSLFETYFSIKCDSSSSLSFQYSLLSLVIQYLFTSSSSICYFYSSPHFSSIMCFRRYLLRKNRPIQIAFLLFIVYRTFLSSRVLSCLTQVYYERNCSY